MRYWHVFFSAFFTALFVCHASMAHFQVIYTPETTIREYGPSELRLTLLFTHPFEGGPVMDMGKDMEGRTHRPVSFGVMLQQGKRLMKVDLLDAVRPVQFRTPVNQAVAYEAVYKNPGMGDLVFYVEPSPYWEPAEDCYIQHCTKLIVNRMGIPTCWDMPVGLPVEIVPLDRPYALWTGNVFRGVVLHNGKPVPDCEIEVEYLNYSVEKNSFVHGPAVTSPGAAFSTQIIKTDRDGVFVYGIPRAGWWGFAALGCVSDAEYRGKDLELAPVIWVQAVDMK
ncbi:MAG TPA: DUF4198 domain-containing protein [Thermodesulfobacteriaceae bacterium]|nr:DUF4198 domain-containing protein [Thermodesulfobacteriaceae bacterium]